MEPSTLVHTASLSTCRVTSGFASTASTAPSELSDAELLTATRRLVGRSNQLLASLLAHLGEVEARGIHRARACSSLYAYCIYELRFSEDEAFRRVTAARLVRRFPALLEAVASGELHLTGLLMLGPLLTADNFAEVLARAKHRTKKELARLVRTLDPLPQVPSRFEPLGPASSRPVAATATRDHFMSALNPVRELDPGERPREWIESAALGDSTALDDSAVSGHDASAVPADSALARANPGAEVARADFRALGDSAVSERDASSVPADSALARADRDAEVIRAEPALRSLASPAQLEPQRYKVQFEASEEYVELVAKAKALLSHANARMGLGELHLRAMRTLVTALERKKYAARASGAQLLRQRSGASLEHGHKRGREQPHDPPHEHPLEHKHKHAHPHEHGCEHRREHPHEHEHGYAHEHLHEHGYAHEHEHGREPPLDHPREHGREPPLDHPRQRGRQVPAALRRAVYERDDGRCTYQSDSGQRCRETARLEFHHLVPFARGGGHRLENLTLRCGAHNALAAEQDFGRGFVALARDARRHEPRAAFETRAPSH